MTVLTEFKTNCPETTLAKFPLAVTVKTERCDYMLPGQDCRTLQGKVVDEHGAE